MVRGVWVRGLTLAKGVFKWLRRPVRALARRRGQVVEQWGWQRTEWAIEAEIERIVGRGRPLVVGPWISEVGYETLYWLPFLRWVQAAFRLEPNRVIAVSRGGAEAWYSDIAAR